MPPPSRNSCVLPYTCIPHRARARTRVLACCVPQVRDEGRDAAASRRAQTGRRTVDAGRLGEWIVLILRESSAGLGSARLGCLALTTASAPFAVALASAIGSGAAIWKRTAGPDRSPLFLASRPHSRHARCCRVYALRECLNYRRDLNAPGFTGQSWTVESPRTRRHVTFPRV